MNEEKEAASAKEACDRLQGAQPPAAEAPSESRPKVVPPRKPEVSNELTAEEQMALYEKELKENDWGHQPC